MVKVNTPYGMHLSEEDTGKLAHFVKQCAKDQLALENTKEAYHQCITRPESASSWWSQPGGVWAVGIISFSLGLISAQWIK
jgi:hypothetical protein